MEIGGDVCYRALEARDARFDGKFFTAVRTTGVYCRPICPAKRPRRKNCTFYRSAAAAAEAGYRPCLRCRPESSPGTPAWAGTSATVTRALRLIGEGALVDAGVDELASRLGMGARQLRRLFVEHLGAAPAAVEQTRRIHFAKKLLDETDLPITEIAFASGFGSVRRFNSAIRCAYARAPRELRRRRQSDATGGSIRLRLGYRPPFSWSQVIGFLRLRAIPGVELVADNRYARSVSLGGFTGVVQVRPGHGDWLELETPCDAASELPRVVAGVRSIFDLGADPSRISDQLGSDPIMRSMVRRCPGLRVPGTWDPCELTVRAILGQQVTVRGATTLAGRIASARGEPLETDVDGISLLFPTPEALLDMQATGQGMPTKRVETIRSMASAVVEDASFFDAEDVQARLCEIPGIGPWTAGYVAMRALGDPDAFPSSDLGLRKALARIEGGAVPTASSLSQRSATWRPWRAYAAMHLWNSLASADYRQSSRGAQGDRKH